MMNKYFKIVAVALISVMAVGMSGCRKTRISYVDMVKREKSEMQAYMDSVKITVQNEFPSGLVTPNNVFVQVPELEDLYIRVVQKGDTSLLEDQKTIVVTRFNLEDMSPRIQQTWNLNDEKAGNTQPLPFIYVENYNKIMPNLYMDPNAVLEVENQPFLCRALLEAVKIAGLNSEVEIITSFRYGPSFASNEGIPFIFRKVTFKAKP